MEFSELLSNYNNHDKKAPSINVRIVAKSDDDDGCCCIKCANCLDCYGDCLLGCSDRFR